MPDVVRGPATWPCRWTRPPRATGRWTNAARSRYCCVP